VPEEPQLPSVPTQSTEPTTLPRPNTSSQQRQKSAHAEHDRLLGKSTPQPPPHYQPTSTSTQPPRNSNTGNFPEPWSTQPLHSKTLAKTCDHILRWQQPEPTPCNFRFELTCEAAQHNLYLLQTHNFDLETAIQMEGGTALQYGSEFKPSSILRPLLQHHPFWPKIERHLTTGVESSMTHQSEQVRRRAVAEALLRGNHKSARDNPERLMSLLRDEAHDGFGLPLPTTHAASIPDCWLAPLGIQLQDTIDAMGRIIEKTRLTHDLS
jgi:hypothetical protein